MDSRRVHPAPSLARDKIEKRTEPCLAHVPNSEMVREKA